VLNALAPSILVMVTSFTRIVGRAVVSSAPRSACSRARPSNRDRVAGPVPDRVRGWRPTLEQAVEQTGSVRLIKEEINEATALERTIQPFPTAS